MHMLKRIKRIGLWSKINWKDMVRILTILAVGMVCAVLLNFVIGRSKAIQELKDDNSKQTVILCTLILKKDTPLSDGDITKIQKICKQRISQSTPTQPTTPTQTPTANPSASIPPNPSSSAQSTPVENPSTVDSSAPPATPSQPPAPPPDNRGPIQKIIDLLNPLQ